MAEDWFEDKANNIMSSVPGYSMKTVEYHDGYAVFQGTWPENVQPADTGWTGLLY